MIYIYLLCVILYNWCLVFFIFFCLQNPCPLILCHCLRLHNWLHDSYFIQHIADSFISLTPWSHCCLSVHSDFCVCKRVEEVKTCYTVPLWLFTFHGQICYSAHYCCVVFSLQSMASWCLLNPLNANDKFVAMLKHGHSYATAIKG